MRKVILTTLLLLVMVACQPPKTQDVKIPEPKYEKVKIGVTFLDGKKDTIIVRLDTGDYVSIGIGSDLYAGGRTVAVKVKSFSY